MRRKDGRHADSERIESIQHAYSAQVVKSVGRRLCVNGDLCGREQGGAMRRRQGDLDRGGPNED